MDTIEEARGAPLGRHGAALPFVPGHSTTGTVNRLRGAD